MEDQTDTYYDGHTLYSIHVQGQQIGKLEQSRESLFALLSLLWVFQIPLYLCIILEKNAGAQPHV